MTKQGIFYLWLRLPNGESLHCGNLALASTPLGRIQKVEFRYTEAYLAHPGAFALDPLHLPLQPGIASLDCNGRDLPGFIDDIMPDRWGRAVIARYYTREEQTRIDPNDNIEILQRLPVSSIGALRAVPQAQGMDEPEWGLGVPIERLQLLNESSQAFDQFVDEDQLQHLGMQLLMQGSSVGGARPKALVYDDQASYIAKFSRKSDQFDHIAVEHACLRLAEAAGMAVPRSVIGNTTQKRHLLVERFDLTPAGGRHHLVSMNALLKDPQDHSDNLMAAYNDLARLVRTYSIQPTEDLKQLFGQMLLNEVIGNRDDHLRNFSMLHTGDGWQLTPAYDIVPDLELGKYPQLRFGYRESLPGLAEAENAAKAFNLTPREGRQIAASVRDVMQAWRQVFVDAGVVPGDLKAIARVVSPEFSRRPPEGAPMPR